MGCAYRPNHQDIIPKHDTFELVSEVVHETRVINVWLPEGYQEGQDSFAVLYMPDGGIKEDFPHIANTLAALIANKEIPPLILVGIENTVRGRDLTGFSTAIDYDAKYAPITDGAKEFRAFIATELVATIDSRYRTKTKKGLVGESLAGLFVVETLLNQPALFDCYIAMDPSLWWNDNYLVKNAAAQLEKFPTKNIQFWFAGSAVQDISKHTNQLAKILETDAPSSLKWQYSDEPNEKHATIFRATKEKAFRWALAALAD